MPALSPTNPIEAVTHPDPYQYYTEVIMQRPIYWDARLRLWVASSASAVSAVLTNPICRVRPLAEPVPSALLGSPAAEIFRYLVRMNDGERYCPFKQAISSSIESLEARSIVEESRKWASLFLSGSQTVATSHALENFAFHLPIYVVASLLGVPQNMLQETVVWMGDFVRCLAPTSTTEQIERGKAAAGHLLDLMHTLLGTSHRGTERNLLIILEEQAKGIGCEARNIIAANAIGFLSQAYEATAGLIGNTVVYLGSHQDALEEVQADPELLSPVLAEVLRYDSPIQNTRRFLAQNGSVAGQEMKEGDVVLVVLAAANRDPEANPEPEQFKILREKRRTFTFGMGPHICPGETLATLIAQAGVSQLLDCGIDLARLARNATYRASANVRVALLTLQ
ncbi:cytochrome P450 [Ktedonobacter racemifer]|uniref:Cytochrome P450 n=1 Tax=Ktedonobacter racemifer DSM 44963 TaxID=485913 RepID=D6TVA1_KTERA|nr:cytochrome P450 [Ktedonobacter racemifer]EFH84201.1 cytochrome P450 [Ktedonobacter racemifer DSM 44963]